MNCMPVPEACTVRIVDFLWELARMKEGGGEGGLHPCGLVFSNPARDREMKDRRAKTEGSELEDRRVGDGRRCG